MKTAPAGQDYIDYWTRKKKMCSGIRVWRDRCQLITSDTDPSALAATGDSYKLPLRDAIMDTVPAVGFTFLDVKPPITQEVLLIVNSDAGTDIVAVLKQEKPFDEARRDASPSYQ